MRVFLIALVALVWASQAHAKQDIRRTTVNSIEYTYHTDAHFEKLKSGFCRTLHPDRVWVCEKDATVLQERWNALHFSVYILGGKGEARQKSIEKLRQEMSELTMWVIQFESDHEYLKQPPSLSDSFEY